MLDASLLLLPLVGFLPATIRAWRRPSLRSRELSEGGLIRRKKAKVDGPNEGAFLACSCWMADCLSDAGRHDEAVAQFERVLALANDVGLLSEEYDVPAKHLAGNFPQALTHLAVVNTALRLSGPVLNARAADRAVTVVRAEIPSHESTPITTSSSSAADRAADRSRSGWRRRASAS